MGKDKRKGWLATLEEGDDVIIQPHRFGGEPFKSVVTRITPTGIIRTTNKGRERSFRPSGRERGKEYSRAATLKPATDEANKAIEMSNKRAKVRAHIRYHFEELTDAQITDIHHTLFEDSTDG